MFGKAIHMLVHTYTYTCIHTHNSNRYADACKDACIISFISSYFGSFIVLITFPSLCFSIFFYFMLFSCIPTSHPPLPFTLLSFHSFISFLTSFNLVLHPSLLGPGTDTFLTWTYLLCRTVTATVAAARLDLRQKSVIGCLTAFLQAQGMLKLTCSISTFVLTETHLQTILRLV